jgi:NitT/TauT family transport system substrate-binding protein
MTSPILTRRRLLEAGAAAAASLAAPAGFAAPLAKAERAKLTVGISVDAASFMPAFIGIARSWKEQGLDVELISFRGDAEVSQALAGDSLDITLQSCDGLINLINAGQPAIAFYAGCNQADFAWCAQPQIKDWAQLKGSGAGVSTLGSLTDQLTRYVLKRHGLEPEKDVAIVQSGGTASILQALKAGRLGLAILSPPFKWMAEEAGFNRLGSQADDIAPQWPKHVYIAKQSFIDQNPNTLKRFLRGHVEGLRLARRDPDFAVKVLIDRLKWEPAFARRAYEEVLPSYDERGHLPESRFMDVFWKIEEQGGTVKEPWPQAKLLDDRFIRSFDEWAA